MQVGSYGLSAGVGCRPCHCSTFGSIEGSCDVNGRCSCKAGIGGQQCTDVRAGFFAKNVTIHRFEAEEQTKWWGKRLTDSEFNHTGSGVYKSDRYGYAAFRFKSPQEITGYPVIRMFMEKVRGGGSCSCPCSITHIVWILSSLQMAK